MSHRVKMILLVAWTLFPAGGGAATSEVDHALDRKSVPGQIMKTTGGAWEAALAYWSESEKVPVGLLVTGKFLKRAGDAAKKSQKPLAGRELLDGLVRVNPSYEWSKVDGVLNVLPRNRSSTHLLLLQKAVDNFSVDAVTPQQAIYLLFQHMKIPARMNFFVSGPKPKQVSPQNFKCSSATVIQCMNLIVKEAGGSFWYLHYEPKANVFVIGRQGETFRDEAEH